MASEGWEARGGGVKCPPLKRRNSPKSPDADVALYDVTNNRFQTVKRRDAESVSHQN
jgi:hypothetical protein